MNLDARLKCVKCEKDVRSVLHFDENLKIVDTDGGLLFGAGWRCDNCLDELTADLELAHDGSPNEPLPRTRPRA